MAGGPAGNAAGRAATRRRRLSRSADFDRVYREGRSHASPLLVVYSFPSAGGAGPRLGVSVGRRVGGAVERNRVKRLLRDAFWSLAPGLPEEHDFVIIARPDLGEVARSQGERGVEVALRELLVDGRLLEAEAT